MKKKRKHKNSYKRERGVTEVLKTKGREEEEKFFMKFSATELNGISLLILASTFLVQGIVRYFEIINKQEFLKPWFIVTIASMIFLVSAVTTVMMDAIVRQLKWKRRLAVASILCFIIGFFVFLGSLVFLLVIISL